RELQEARWIGKGMKAGHCLERLEGVGAVLNRMLRGCSARRIESGAVAPATSLADRTCQLAGCHALQARPRFPCSLAGTGKEQGKKIFLPCSGAICWIYYLF
ncbi:MAG: hypothetical protein ABI810_09045, partial [Sphingomonas bacterium]